MDIQAEETIGFATDYEASLGYTTEAEYWEEYDLIKSGKYNMPF
jgi:hypothetical protein